MPLWIFIKSPYKYLNSVPLLLTSWGIPRYYLVRADPNALKGINVKGQAYKKLVKETRDKIAASAKTEIKEKVAMDSICPKHGCFRAACGCLE